MRTRILALVPPLVVGLVAPVTAQDVTPTTDAGETTAARWYAGVDALWLTRDYPSNAPLARTVVLDPNFKPVPLAGVPPLTLNGVSDKAARPGVRATVGYQTGRTGFELGYFGIQQWDRSATLPVGDPPFASSPFLGSSIIYGNKSFDTSVTARYESQIHSAEANARRSFNCGNWAGSALAGFRYFHLSEQFGLTGLQTFPNLAAGRPPLSQTIVERTRATADNDLFGAQVGGEVGRAWFDDRVGLAVNGKVGIFANSANQYTTNGANLPGGGPGTAVLAAGRGRTDFASLYEGGVATTVKLTPRVTLRAGYQVVFVQGLALAPTQLAQTGTAIQNSSRLVPGAFTPSGVTPPTPSLPAPGTGSELNTSGNLLLHGPSVGLGVAY